MPTFDVILFSDSSDKNKWRRGYGAHRIASHLREKGISCLVVDFSSYIDFDIWTDICDRAIGSNTKFIGFSTTWWPYRNPNGDDFLGFSLLQFAAKNYDYSKSLVYAAGSGQLGVWLDYAKKINQKIKIIIGGPKAPLYIDVPADHFIIGHGETQIIDLLTQTRRIWPRIINHDTEAKNSDWDFKYSSTRYTEYDQIKSHEILMFEFSRGCRFKCSFCNYPLIGRKDISSYVKDSDVIYEELSENYERFGIINYQIADDTLNDSTEKLEHIVKAIKKLPFQPTFQAYTRLDVMVTNPIQVDLLKEMNLIRTWIGLDSLHPIASKAIGKGMSEERKKDMLWQLKDKWGRCVTIDAGYIVGLPGEPADFTESVFEWADAEDSPLYSVEFIPLILAPDVPVLQHQNKSLMDLNYEQYGYKIPNLQRWWEWIKDDNTGLNSFADASALAQKLNQSRTPRNYPQSLLESSEIEQNPDWYFKNLIEKLG